MALVPYTITVIERDTADAAASGKQVVVGAVCSMFLQPTDTTALLYDDAEGNGGSTAKTTNANGQVTVYVDAGDYRVSANGNSSFISLKAGGTGVVETVTETQTLAAAQTVVTLVDVTTTSTAFYINGASVDNGRLVLGVDYTVDTTAQITLATSYADGTLITAVQNDTTEGIKPDIQAFDSVFDMQQSTIEVGKIAKTKGYYTPNDGGGAEYLIVAGAVVDGYVDHENTNGTFSLLINKGALLSPLIGCSFSLSASENALRIEAGLAAVGHVDVTQEIPVSNVTMISNSTLSFSAFGKFIQTTGERAIGGSNAFNIKIINPNIEGTYTNSPNLADHAIKLEAIDNLKIINPYIRSVGGNGIQLEFCTNSLVENIDVKDVGFLGFIGVDCVNTDLRGGVIADAYDAFSCQFKGSTSCVIDGVKVINPNSCGIIINTNSSSLLECLDCKVINCSVSGTSSRAPTSGTKGLIFMQAKASIVANCTVRGNTESIGSGIQVSGKDTQVVGCTIEDISAIGLTVTGALTYCSATSCTIQRCQDKGVLHNGGRLILGSGNKISNNGLASATLPNVQVTGVDFFSVTGSLLETVLTGASRYNIKLEAGAYDVSIIGNTFVRNNANDVHTTTGEMRVDLSGFITIHSNSNAVVQVTNGWATSFEIKNRNVLAENYARNNFPTTGSWLTGDRILTNIPTLENGLGWVCTVSGTAGTWEIM